MTTHFSGTNSLCGTPDRRVMCFRSGFTRIELACVVAVMGLLGGLGLPTLATQRIRSDRAQCIGNLRRLGQAFLTWAEDHRGEFPFRVSYGLGGSNGKTTVAEHLAVMSNSLASPRLLTCPATIRLAATSFSGLRDTNIAYALLVHAVPDRQRTILATDWDLEGGPANSCNVAGKLTVDAFFGRDGLPESFTSSWSATNHAAWGQILFSDGSVQSGDSWSLKQAMALSSFEGDGTTHALKPKQ